MLPYFVIDQIVLGPIKFYTWGLFVGLGFSAGYLWFYYLARKENLAPKKIAGLALAIFLGAILGAKVLAVAALSGVPWQMIFTAHSGASFMGGLVGAIVGGALYVLLVKLDLWRISDLLVLPTLLGIGIGRIGCILINDHMGAVTNLPWGILWPDGIIRHSVAVYESLLGFGLLAVFWWIKYKIDYRGNKNINVIPAKAGIQDSEPGSRLKAGMTKKKNDGRFFLLFLLFYSFLRFLLDFTRVSSGPLADPRWGALSVSQWVAAGIFFVSLSLFIYRKRC